MNTARRQAIQAIAPPGEGGVPWSRAREHAAFAVRVTGLTFAKACSQLGMLKMGTNTEVENKFGITNSIRSYPESRGGQR